MAECLAESLGYPCVAREILQQAAKALGASVIGLNAATSFRIYSGIVSDIYSLMEADYRHAAELSRLEQPRRHRFRQPRREQFRLRDGGESRPDGRRSGSAGARLSHRTRRRRHARQGDRELS